MVLISHEHRVWVFSDLIPTLLRRSYISQHMLTSRVMSVNTSTRSFQTYSNLPYCVVTDTYHQRCRQMVHTQLYDIHATLLYQAQRLLQPFQMQFMPHYIWHVPMYMPHLAPFFIRHYRPSFYIAYLYRDSASYSTVLTSRLPETRDNFGP